MRTLPTRGSTSCRRRTWFRAPVYNSADCAARQLRHAVPLDSFNGLLRQAIWQSTPSDNFNRLLRHAARPDSSASPQIRPTGRQLAHPRPAVFPAAAPRGDQRQALYCGQASRKPKPSTQKACFCGWPLPGEVRPFCWTG